MVIGKTLGDLTLLYIYHAIFIFKSEKKNENIRICHIFYI